MRKTVLSFTALTFFLPALAVTTPAHSQDVAQEGDNFENSIIVTASRRERDDYDEYYDSDQSAIGLVRRADYFVKPIYVESDSRDPDLRREEVTAMLNAVIEGAQAEGISLAYGRNRLRPLTMQSLEDVSYGRGSRPDTTRVRIYARIPLGDSDRRSDEVNEQIESFIKTIPATGRSYITTGGTDLAIDNPLQYRAAVVQAIADEAKRYAAMFGSDYGVEIRGLDSELYFKQNSATEVFLYIEHSFVIKPKP